MNGGVSDSVYARAGVDQAGAGSAVRVLVDEGPLRVHELISLGAMFDRDDRGVGV